jgi:hypothetical protein
MLPLVDGVRHVDAIALAANLDLHVWRVANDAWRVTDFTLQTVKECTLALLQVMMLLLLLLLLLLKMTAVWCCRL